MTEKELSKKRMIVDGAVPIFIWADEIEDDAMRQLFNLTQLPFIFHHAAAMPDVHTGYGMPIGGVLATKGAVVPYAIGFDQGCGMGAVRTNVHLSDLQKEDVERTFQLLGHYVPAGHGKAHKNPQDDWKEMNEFLSSTLSIQSRTPGWYTERTWDLAKRNLGTLGGGNHFLDLLVDETDHVWLMVHSGSRNLGHAICTYYHNIAKDMNMLWYSNIPDLDLAFLPIEHAEAGNFIHDMNFALRYAKESRSRMLERFKIAFSKAISDKFSQIEYLMSINIHHNYASLENHYGENVWVHRKGATSAKAGQFGIIPGSMGTPSYIVRGKGEPESFCSCSHGAGRPRSRTATTEAFTKNQANESISHLWYFSGWPRVTRGRLKGRTDISESPLAYKDIDDVIERQSDLVDVIFKLHPVGVMIGK